MVPRICLPVFLHSLCMGIHGPPSLFWEFMAPNGAPWGQPSDRRISNQRDYWNMHAVCRSFILYVVPRSTLWKVPDFPKKFSKTPDSGRSQAGETPEPVYFHRISHAKPAVLIRKAMPVPRFPVPSRNTSVRAFSTSHRHQPARGAGDQTPPEGFRRCRSRGSARAPRPPYWRQAPD